MDKITEPGFYEMEAADYHADPCAVPSLSRGIAHTLVSHSPLHAFAEHPRLSGMAETKETKAMTFGDVAHQVILGKGTGFAIYSGDDWRTNDAKKFKLDAANERKTPILRRDYERAMRMRDEVMRKLERRGLSHAFTGTSNELVAIWKEEDLWFRCMMDAPRFDHHTIFDLKTTTSVDPNVLPRKLIDQGIDMQAVFYPRGVCKLKPDLLGRLKFVIIFAEVEWPHAVTVVQLNGEFQALAESKVERAITLWRQCTHSGIWPEYSEEIVRIAPKPWDMAAEETAKFGGENDGH